MSVESVSATSTAWQTLAELRAARGTPDPDAGAGPDSASAGATPPGGAAGSVAGASAPPPPPANVLQFFQQLQSVDGNAQGSGGASSGASAASGDPQDASTIGSATTGILADFESLLATLQQGGTAATAGVPQGQGAPAGGASADDPDAAAAGSANGSADPSGAAGASGPQTGNDLMLQLLSGLQGGAWQLGAAQFGA